MEAPATTETGGDGAMSVPLTDPERRDLAKSASMWFASTLLKGKWVILLGTFLAGVGAIVYVLSLPVWYAATARVLPPEETGGGLSTLIGELSPLASSVLGGGGGSYNRYIAILASRTVQERIVEEFDLVERYELQDEPFPEEAALLELADNVAFEVDLEFEFLRITAFDQDPEEAARMANALVRELNERNEELALQGASAFRRYVEERYSGIELRLDSARAEMQAFQERNGVVQLPEMAQGFMQSLASAQAEAARAEIEYNALLSEFGPENPQVQAAGAALSAARAAQEDLLGGREAVMPVPFSQLPRVTSEYARIYQELLVQQALLENARPLLEQARFDEARERTAVQVLDEAVPPVLKARPQRSVLVVIITASAFLLLCTVVVARRWYRERGRALLRELQA